MLVDEFDGSGARYVSCGVEDYFDLFSPLSIDFTTPKTLNGQLLTKLNDIAVEKERILGDAMLLSLTLHYVDRVTQHARRKGDIGRGGDDGRLWVLRGHDGHGTEVIEVAVREHYQVKVYIFNRLEVRQSIIAKFLRIEPRIDQDIEATDLYEH